MARTYTKKKDSTKPKRKYTKKKKVEKVEEPKKIEVVKKEKPIMKEEKKLGRLISSNRFPTEVKYNGESTMIPARGCVPDRKSPPAIDKNKLGELPLGIRYIDN